jgi:hypothetical protein
MKSRKKKPRLILRVTAELRRQVLEDLKRPHAHAWERVGFLYTRSKWLDDRTLVIIATAYEPVADAHYLKDDTVGAKIGADAIRNAMQKIVSNKTGCFHVHLHGHSGKPTPSGTDTGSLPGVVQSLANIAGEQVTGYIVLSLDAFFTAIHLPGRKGLHKADQVSVVGFPMEFHFEGTPAKPSAVFDRQSFLGSRSQWLFDNTAVGISGYGGGGSHVGQQLAHIGVKNPVIFDDDHIEDSNLNRLVGGRWKDVLQRLAKTRIAKRTIKAILPAANVTAVPSKWQNAPEKLQACDLVIGCVDSYAERQQLEAECRRYLIPYIDIGMDVHSTEGEPPSMSGQVMLSMPGLPCFWCFGFLTKEKLGLEAAKYGNVGGRPQVVWPNGVLASTAVGILVELITGWTKRTDARVYLEYDGNTGILKDHIRLRFCDDCCAHYHTANAGPVIFRPI